MSDKIYARIISTILLACAILALAMIMLASNTYEVCLTFALSLVSGTLGLAVARDAK
jgi:hypothetical protein